MRSIVSGFAVALIVISPGTGLWARQRGAGPGPGGAPAPAIGIIVGRVVDAGTGQPVAEAEVAISIRAPAPQVPTTLLLLTGADGRFVARDLPAGNVQVSARASGYLNGTFGQTRPGSPSRPIQVTAETPMVAASVRLWRQAVLTGMVTDEGNEPAINIQVRAMVRTFKGGRARFGTASSGRTDDRGLYRIPGLAPGDYVVVVPQVSTTMPVATMDDAMQDLMGGQGLGAAVGNLAAAGGMAGGIGVRVGDQLVSTQSGASPVMSGDGRMAAYVTQYYPAAAVAADATVFTLESGEELGGVDIRMPLAPTAKISGSVIGPDGPLSNVPIRLVNVAEPYGDILSDVARSSTAANGSFQMFGVPVGQYVIKVLRPARQPLPAALATNPQLAALMGGRGGDPISPGDSLTLFANVPLSVEGDISDLTINLSTGATVSGRVEFTGASALPPVTGATVSLTPYDGLGADPAIGGAQLGALGGVALPMRPSQVGEDGSFVTPGSPVGRYFMTIGGRTPGWFVKSAMVNGIDALEQPFELTTENIGNIVVTFTDRQTTVSGTVTGAGSAPGAGTVIVFPAAYREWISKGMPMRLMRTTRTQAKGAFSIAGLPARDYLIVAVADEQLPDVQNPAVYDALARAATSVTLSDGETRTVSIKLAQVTR